MIWAGTQRTKKAKRFRKYLALIGRRESISITTLAQAMPVSVHKACDDLQDMLDSGILETGYLDMSTGRLILSDEGLQEEAPPAPEPDEPEPEEENSEQFDVSDQRTLDEVVNWLMKMGYIPSFCTACYREGRTGDRFMALCKNMQILNCCHPNALMTLKEYLEDYAGEETKKIGMELIDRELEKIPNSKVKQTAYEHIHDIAEGKRDFRF